MTTAGKTSDHPAAPAEAAPAGAEPLDGHALLGQLGSEVAMTLSAALESVTTLATTGKIGRKGLRDLREAIERARRTSMMGQQVHRLASGRVRLNIERIDLTTLLRDSLRQHRRQQQALGIEIRAALGPAQVMADPTLVFALVETLFDWSLEHARSPVDLRLELTGQPPSARLSSAFHHGGSAHTTPADAARPTLDGAALQTMSWRLMQQTAQTLALPITLQDDGSRASVQIGFPRTVNDPSESAAQRDRPDAARQGLNSKPLAGAHVLVLASRRETRALVRDALRHMGLMVDFVATLDEAREFCRGGMPNAILHDSTLSGDRFERLRGDLLAELPQLAFIELTEDGQGIGGRQVGNRRFSCVARSSIVESLPAALLFELSHPR